MSKIWKALYMVFRHLPKSNAWINVEQKRLGLI